MSQLRMPVTDRDHLLGSPDEAAIVLLEYGDYECPYCGMAQATVHGLIEALGEQMCLAFRHFPLTQVHPHALHAAEAAEAAAAQGAFWPMHELLYQRQQQLDDTSLVEYAGELGLDVDRFADELASGVHEARVREDFLSGARSGVNGTPSFFINGERYLGSYDLESMLAALRSVMPAPDARAGKRRPPRTSPRR
ncbi:MAG TPA: DsbA family protein [Usitatibacter sp.]|jgi:protein-disulfide isomerase|nr:DsbA family protein [Usitatibacter sp.]